MLDNTITLAVDTANSGTTTDQDYTRYSEHENRTVYVGETHSMVARDEMSVYRTFPKPNGTFRGVSKTAIKFTEDQVVYGVDGVSQLTAPVILDIQFSIPVGITTAKIVELRQRAIALLDKDTVMDKVNVQLQV